MRFSHEVVTVILHRSVVLVVVVLLEQIDRAERGADVPSNRWGTLQVPLESCVQEFAEDHVRDLGHLHQHVPSEGMLDCHAD